MKLRDEYFEEQLQFLTTYLDFEIMDFYLTYKGKEYYYSNYKTVEDLLEELDKVRGEFLWLNK